METSQTPEEILTDLSEPVELDPIEPDYEGEDEFDDEFCDVCTYHDSVCECARCIICQDKFLKQQYNHVACSNMECKKKYRTLKHKGQLARIAQIEERTLHSQCPDCRCAERTLAILAGRELYDNSRGEEQYDG